MRKGVLALVVLGVGIISCNSVQSGKEPQESKVSVAALEGTWELNYVANAPIPFDILYKQTKPFIVFDTVNGTFSGNNGCNNFKGKLITQGNTIDFSQPIATTRMACRDARAENLFMESLKKINGYSVSQDRKTLNFLTGDVGTMRFSKK